MAGQLRVIAELEADIEARGLRGVTKQDLLDILKSQAKVAGTLNINKATSPDTDIVILPGWNRIDVWEASRDTQGVQDGLNDTPAKGRFKIKNNADGDYTVSATLRFTVDTAGLYEIRVEKVEADEITTSDTLWQDAATLEVGEQGHLAIASALIKNVLKNEYLQLSIKGPNGSTVTINYGQFGVQR